MKRLLCTLALLLLSAPAWAVQTTTFTRNASDTPWSASASATITVSAATGDTICVLSGSESNGNPTPTVTDNGSTSYSLIVTNNAGLFLPEAWMHCGIATGSVTTVTVTLPGTDPNKGGLGAWVITGSHATTIGNSNSGINATGSTSHTSNSVTLTDASGVVVGGTICTPNSAGWTISTGFTTDYSGNFMLYGSKSITANETMTNTSGASRESATLLVEIRPAATSANTSQFRLRVQW